MPTRWPASPRDTVSSMSEPLDLVTVGELLCVIAPLALRTRLEFSTSLEQSVGGAEVNVALSLARLGHHVGWCGSVGADPFGRFGLRVLTDAGVDVSRVMVSTSAPTGIYFKDPLPSGGLRTHSYRRSTAASDLTLSDVDVDYVLSGRVVHLTGITALISHAGFDLVSGLITAARHRNIYVSFDANIRHSLARGRDPAALLGPLAREADIIFLSSSEARTIFATSDPECLQAELSNMHAQALVVHDSLAAYAITRDLVERVAARRIGVVDATGAGDAIVAGYLSGWLEGLRIRECLVRAEHCAAQAVSTYGDSPIDLDRTGLAAMGADA